MLDLLQSCAKNPDILIDGNSEENKKLTDLFLKMTESFYERANSCSFCPFSINGKKELLIPDKNQKYFMWEQINRSNHPLIIKASQIDFDADDRLRFENEEEEEEEEAKEEPVQDADDFNDFLEGKSPEEEDDEEDEEELAGPIDQIHISDLDEEEENHEGDDIIKDGVNEEEFSRLLIEEDDDNSNQQYTYNDLFGDAPPVSDNDEKELDKDLNETEGEEEESIDPKAKQIKDIEKKLISKKAWELSGETLAVERPADSLADIDLDFEFANNEPPQAPATSEIEDIIIKRIESMNFDDVVRKQNPVETRREIFEISTEKSKVGLADVYANEFLKETQENSQDSENNLTPKQREAINLWYKLDNELNKFTERRHISRRPKENITVSQSVSLDVEEKPEPSKAPEEIMAPVGSTRQMKGEAEVTHDERKAERRTIKAKHQKKQIEKDAARGILYSQNGGDGAEIGIQKDIDKLLKGNLAGVEVVKDGGAISSTKQRPKNLSSKSLL